MALQRAASVLATALVLTSILTGKAGCSPWACGVCYGVHGDRLPKPAEVVQLYKSKGITAIRLYEPDVQTLLALNGSNIGVLIDVADENVPRLASGAAQADLWVQLNIKRYYPGVSFRYIAVGNELAGAATRSILPAIKNLNAALAKAGIKGIKVSTAVKMDVLATSSPPSSAVFKDDYMKQIVALLGTTGAPLLVNVYPYFAYIGDQKNIDLNFSLFQPSSRVIKDNGLSYTNLFDAMVDAVYAALRSAKVQVPVVISESGWPSAGGVGASVANARTYNQNLINHVGKGTPSKSQPLETYVFAMFNENRKTGAETEKHFGLFNPDKSPVYPIKF
ncbi:glucan endo-1,3-beta-glucosidase GII-like isoform X1 [Aegilops tauschii subsp. strangulata]